ncbi:ubiquitin-like protein Pup [Brevibacterium sp. 2SA]|uniref:ubiquitin-like protein Pup n=1 Tax=Brevibacterium sp. 2SA TaxID=2502198 RepID=UPI0010F8324D|nr:ubiquitin-like protein Pup [Brevibacterium sp. 2SA]
MSSNEQINKDHSAGGDEPPVDPPQVVSAQINTENVDSILDEIDSVLESNAEEFVRNFVQKGGQ